MLCSVAVTGIPVSAGAPVVPCASAMATFCALRLTAKNSAVVMIIPKNPAFFLETAAAVKEAGAHVLRGGVWKPRTNPYSFQGDAKSVDILMEASRLTGLPRLSTEPVVLPPLSGRSEDL